MQEVTKPEDRRTVRELREGLGLSQVEVAHQLGVSEPTYRRYENDPGVISLRKSLQLASIFGVKLVDIALYNSDEPAS